MNRTYTYILDSEGVTRRLTGNTTSATHLGYAEAAKPRCGWSLAVDGTGRAHALPQSGRGSTLEDYAAWIDRR